MCLWQDDISRRTQIAVIVYNRCRTVSADAAEVSVSDEWPLSSYILCVRSPPRGITRERQRRPKPNTCTIYRLPAAADKRPAITCSDFTPGWVFDIQQLDEWSRYTPPHTHGRAEKKAAICSIPFEREMLSLSDTSKIYPIKHKKMRSTHVAQKLYWEMVSFLKDKWVIFIQNENRLLWTQSRSIR